MTDKVTNEDMEAAQKFLELMGTGTGDQQPLTIVEGQEVPVQYLQTAEDVGTETEENVVVS